MPTRPPTAKERLLEQMERASIAQELIGRSRFKEGVMFMLEAAEEALMQTSAHSEAWAAIRALRAELEESR